MLLLPSFEDFEYVGCLGSGGHGTVYCARHTLSKKHVAIKVADGCNANARHQLEVEKRILCRYGHTNPYMIKAYCSFHRGVDALDNVPLRITRLLSFRRNYFL